jgi:ABC-type tungstate transport system permease subunit
MKPESYARLMQADAELERRRDSEAVETRRSAHAWDPYNTGMRPNSNWNAQAVRANTETNVSETGLLRVLHAAFRNLRSSL